MWAGLIFAPVVSAGAAQIGLEDPFLRWFTHMAGKLVLVMG